MFSIIGLRTFKAAFIGLVISMQYVASFALSIGFTIVSNAVY